MKKIIKRKKRENERAKKNKEERKAFIDGAIFIRLVFLKRKVWEKVIKNENEEKRERDI
jgi:hypothetical protein